MATHEITVQDCGCLALPDDLATALAIGPGTVLRIEAMSEHEITMTRVSSPHTSPLSATASCSIAPKS